MGWYIVDENTPNEMLIEFVSRTPEHASPWNLTCHIIISKATDFKTKEAATIEAERINLFLHQCNMGKWKNFIAKEINENANNQ